MALTLDEVVQAPFRATRAADELQGRVKDILGLGAHLAPARLAIARSLAVPEPPGEAAGEVGRPIRGAQLFGTGAELATWLSLIVEHADRAPKSLREFGALVSAHWVRGAGMLAETLDRVGDDPAEFWLALAEESLPPGTAPPGAGAGRGHVGGEVRVALGPVSRDAQDDSAFDWWMNDSGSSPHAAFMGGIGSGKTRTAIGALKAIRARAEVPMVAFDFKGDMTEPDTALDRAFGATVIEPPGTPIPLDVLALADRSPDGVKLAALRLRDSLATLKGAGFGAVQKGRMVDAAEQVLSRHPHCTLGQVRDALKALYRSNNWKEDGATGTLDELSRFTLFQPTMDPATFFGRSWVIRLRQDLPELVRVAVVTLVTDALDRYLNAQPDSPTVGGSRNLRVLCVIDEAHRILGSDLPGLSNLIRLSRSKGGAVTLISQSPADFAGVDDDFLAEMGLVLAFATNAPAQSIKRILGPAAANLARLEQGRAWIKLRGAPDARLVRVWR